MPLLLTPEQLEAIKKVVARHHAALVLKFVGPEALTDAETDSLSDGDVGALLDTVLDSYVYGQVLAQARASPSTTLPEFKTWLSKNPVQLSAPEQFAVQAAQQHAGAHIRHLGARIQQQFDMLVFSEDAQFRARALADVVRPKVAENVQKREGIGSLKFELGRRLEDWERDWNRVAVTEKVNAMNRGVADDYRERHGDPWVFKRTMADACAHCRRLHNGPDGKPRMFRLSTLEANGTNVGLKAADWNAVVGSTHPHCQCQLVRVPDGWGFNAEGDLVPGGEFGVKYESEAAAEKAMVLEDELQKSFRIRERINFQGIPVAIEQRVGDLRRWTDPTGYEGQTRMHFAYGYVEGSLGPDGDEYDVYVGPDPTAPFVFVVHQDDPSSGEWDEDKAMLGFPDVHTARDAYLVHYDREEFLGSISMVPIDEFRQKVVGTRRPGSMLADGMVKAEVSPPSAASYSVVGDRAVYQGTSGPQLVIGMDQPFAHLQAARPRVQVSPDELAGVEVRKQQRGGERLFVVREDVETYRRIPGVDVSENVYPFDPRNGPAQQIGIEQLAQIPDNRRVLENEINRRLRRVAPNVADPKNQDRTPPHPFNLPDDYEERLAERLVVARRAADGVRKALDRPADVAVLMREVYRDLHGEGAVRRAASVRTPSGWAVQNSPTWVDARGRLSREHLAKAMRLIAGWFWTHNRGVDAPLQKSARGGPYYGPRGGMWADPQHTVPWKRPVPRKRRGELQVTWKDAYPRGFPAPNFSEDAWRPSEFGKRGGTEQVYYDADKSEWAPARKALHTKIVARAFAAKAGPPKGRKPRAVISMGGPGSGKTTLLKMFGQGANVVEVNSDDVKAQLPEFEQFVRAGFRTAASATHHESHVVMTQIFQRVVDEKRDFVLDRTGADRGDFVQTVKDLQAKGFEVQVYMPHVSADQAVDRTEKRGRQTGRFVPERLVRSIYRRVPGNFAAVAAAADSAILVDNTGSEPRTIFTKDAAGVGTIHEEDLADEFPGLEDLVTQEESVQKSDKKADWTTSAARLNALAVKAEADEPVRFEAGQGILVRVFSDGKRRYVLEGKEK